MAHVEEAPLILESTVAKPGIARRQARQRRRSQIPKKGWSSLSTGSDEWRGWEIPTTDSARPGFKSHFVPATAGTTTTTIATTETSSSSPPPPPPLRLQSSPIVNHNREEYIPVTASSPPKRIATTAINSTSPKLPPTVTNTSITSTIVATTGRTVTTIKDHDTLPTRDHEKDDTILLKRRLFCSDTTTAAAADTTTTPVMPNNDTASREMELIRLQTLLRVCQQELVEQKQEVERLTRQMHDYQHHHCPRSESLPLPESGGVRAIAPGAVVVVGNMEEPLQYPGEEDRCPIPNTLQAVVPPFEPRPIVESESVPQQQQQQEEGQSLSQIPKEHPRTELEVEREQDVCILQQLVDQQQLQIISQTEEMERAQERIVLLQNDLEMHVQAWRREREARECAEEKVRYLTQSLSTMQMQHQQLKNCSTSASTRRTRISTRRHWNEMSGDSHETSAHVPTYNGTPLTLPIDERSNKKRRGPYLVIEDLEEPSIRWTGMEW